MADSMNDCLAAELDGLSIDGVRAAELAAEHGTPLFVFSENRIRHNVARLQRAEAITGRPLKICYAAKANSLLGVLSAVRRSGCGVEVNSGGELWKAVQAGFTGDEIIFNGTSKEPWEIKAAIEAGIYAIQVDSLYELSLIERTAEQVGRRTNVSLRLVPDIESGTHSGLRTALLTSKFGMMPEEAIAAAAKYKGSAHVHIRGLHLHLGSQNPDADIYRQAGSALFETMYRIHRETATDLKHLNIGGGFPVDYLAADDAVPLEPVQRSILSADLDPADAIANAWNEIELAARARDADRLLKVVELLVEPGRSIIADAGICLTTVQNIKQRPTSASADSALDTWIFTDAGFNILLSMEIYKWYYHLISASRSAEPHETPYKVAGPLCDGGDVYFDIEGKGRLPDYRMLPADVRPGELLALLNCGAYSLSQASQYNGRRLPAVVLVRKNGKAELMRTRDELTDLALNETI